MRSPMDVASRVPRLREQFDEAGCDAVLVTRLVSIRYLTGFTGSAALLLVRPDDLVFVTDGRYRDQSAIELGAAGVEARIPIGLVAGCVELRYEALLGGDADQSALVIGVGVGLDL